jgi:hypothetical protein
MDAAVPMTATQLALIWPLLGFLLIWMILFAVLAFRPERAKQSEPAGVALSPGNARAPSAPAMLHAIAAQPAPVGTISPVSVVGPSGYDSSNGAGTSATML